MKTSTGLHKRREKNHITARDKWTVFGLAAVASAITIAVIIKLRNSHPHPEWPVAAAMINKISFGRSGGRRYEYILKGVIYEGWTGIGHGVDEPGDIHLIRYNPADKSESEWVSDKTYFLSHDALQFSVARICDKWSSHDSLSYLTYRYDVNGKRHQRVECIAATDAGKFGIGNSYRVQFVTDKPFRVKLIIPAQDSN